MSQAPEAKRLSRMPTDGRHRDGAERPWQARERRAASDAAEAEPFGYSVVSGLWVSVTNRHVQKGGPAIVNLLFSILLTTFGSIGLVNQW